MASTVVEASSPDKNPPSIRVEFSKKDVGQIVGLKPGAVVKLVIEGKVTEVHTREPYDESTGFVGDIYLEASKTKLTDNSDNAVSDMIDESEDE